MARNRWQGGGAYNSIDIWCIVLSFSPLIDKVHVYLPTKAQVDRYIIHRVMVDQSVQIFGAKLGVSVVCATSYLSRVSVCLKHTQRAL